MWSPMSVLPPKRLTAGVLHTRSRATEVEAAPRNGVVPPFGLIGMLALMLVVETVVARYRWILIDPVAFGWVHSGERARLDAPVSDILLAGDSLIQVALYPRIFEAVTGRVTLNLGAGSAPAPLTELLLRRAFSSGARPAAVVFDMKPSLLAGGRKHFSACWHEFLVPYEIVTSSRIVAISPDVVLGVLMPSYRSRPGLRETFFAALRGESSRQIRDNSLRRRNWDVNRGANVMPASTRFDGVITEERHKIFCSNRFHAHPTNIGAARRILSLVIAAGARPYLVIPPFPPGLHERRRRTGADADYSRFLRGLQDEFPALTVLDAREAGYPFDAFFDPSHLNISGGVTLSTDVAAILRADLDSSPPHPTKRWVGLPKFRRRPEPAGLETITQSLAAISSSKSQHEQLTR